MLFIFDNFFVIDEVEDVLPQLNHPLNEFEDGELSQNYLPSQELSYGSGKSQSYSSYSPNKPNGFSYGPQGKPLYGPGKPQGYSYSPEKQQTKDRESEIFANQFGFEEDHNTVDWLKNSVRGEPGRDYPVYASVPETPFKCSEQQFPGYYADIDTQCQLFHICQEDGRANAFLW